MLGRGNLAPASAALAEVRAAARDNDHTRIREVDRWFQDALARIADLPQAARTFEHLTARLRMFVTVLEMDYSQARDTIADEDAAVHDALLDADGLLRWRREWPARSPRRDYGRGVPPCRVHRR
ncbi:FCD domain-containing protein [Streptomyces phaeochromogenes]|uniref:FCD domain-containing protein n=1 Tax=Streptomyces phaeochromogenes TaxID=1923 RepID=UPI003593CE4E